MIGEFLIGIVLVLIGEGIFQIGLVLPWIWYLIETLPDKGAGENKRLLMLQFEIFLLGVFGSILTGTILGGISLFWIFCFWIFRYFNKVFSEPNLVLLVLVMVGMNVVGDVAIGTRLGVPETILLIVGTGVAIRLSQNKSGIRLRRNG